MILRNEKKENKRNVFRSNVEANCNANTEIRRNFENSMGTGENKDKT